MVRKSAVLASLLGLAVSVPVLAGCQASMQAGGSSTANQPPPPPPPPPPPAPTPTPTAPTTEPAPAPAETTTAPSAAPATATPAPAQTTSEAQPTGKVEVKDGTVKIPGNIVFDTGAATLKAGSGSEAVLEQLKAYLDKTPKVTKLRIEGHTDNVGSAEANVELSGQRALTIKRWLVDHGIAKERLIATGFGMNKPIADNSTEEGRAQNRRTEFKIAELFDKRYLNRPIDGGGKVFDY
jgi:OOP family OmpA-OmpF porin